MRFARAADTYIEPVWYLEDDSTRYIIRLVDLLDMRASLLELDAQLERSYDRYAFIRNAWLQRREYQVKDGNVEDQSLELEEEFKDDPEAAPPRRKTMHRRPPTRPSRRRLRNSQISGAQMETGKLPPLLLLHPDDNILVARRDIAAGERVEIDGESFPMPVAIELGHKLARRALAADTRVLKYGAPIGSMKIAVARGEHVHLHNLRSDYLPSTSREMDKKTDGH